MKAIHFFATAFLLCLTAFGSLSIQANNCKTSPMETMDSCPTANFNIANNGCAAGTPVRFYNLSSGATSYLWDFGDGGSSTNVSPEHVYGAAGTYSVKLYAIGDGCTVEFIGTEDVIVG